MELLRMYPTLNTLVQAEHSYCVVSSRIAKRKFTNNSQLKYSIMTKSIALLK